MVPDSYPEAAAAQEDQQQQVQPQQPQEQQQPQQPHEQQHQLKAGASLEPITEETGSPGTSVPELRIVDVHSYLKEMDGAMHQKDSAAAGTDVEKPTVTKAERLTPNIRALCITAFLFTLITVLQVFAAKISHSQALLMDSISMGVDSLTYAGNIVVECRKRDGLDHRKSQLVVCAVSLGLLFYFTVAAARESWSTAQACMGFVVEAEGEAEDVNAWITLLFALGGIVFDVLAMLAFYGSHKRRGEGTQVNMYVAFLHVAADLVRSTSTLVMSLMILLSEMDSACADAYTSLFLAATIVAGASTGLVSWVKLFLAWVGELKTLPVEVGNSKV
jgi:Co/Zn/Cd efflux system component